MPRKNWSYKLFSELKLEEKQYAQGDIIKMQILKMCKVNHPFYGEITVDQAYFNNVIWNFNAGLPAQDVPVNTEHERSKAQARFTGLEQEGTNLYWNLKLTKDWAENLNWAHYKYFSVEVYDIYVWQEDWKTYKNVLVGGAFTNYPFFKGMEKVVASDPDTNNNQSFYFNNSFWVMENLKKLLAKCGWKKLSFSEKKELLKAFNELSEDEQKEVEKEVETAVEKTDDPAPTPDPKKEEDPSKTDPQAHSDPEKVQMQKEIADLKKANKFSAVEKKFSTFDSVSNASNKNELLEMFSTLDEKSETMIFNFLSDQQKIFKELTKWQISQVTVVDWKTMENGKEVVTDKVFSEKVANYAKEKNVSTDQAFNDLKGQYTIKD